VLFGNFAESQSKDFSKEAIDDEKFAEDYGYLSDSDLEDDEVALSRHTSKPNSYPANPFGVPGEDGKIYCEEHEEHVEKGKVVNIPDMACVT